MENSKLTLGPEMQDISTAGTCFYMIVIEGLLLLIFFLNNISMLTVSVNERILLNISCRQNNEPISNVFAIPTMAINLILASSPGWNLEQNSHNPIYSVYS